MVISLTNVLSPAAGRMAARSPPGGSGADFGARAGDGGGATTATATAADDDATPRPRRAQQGSPARNADQQGVNQDDSAIGAQAAEEAAASTLPRGNRQPLRSAFKKGTLSEYKSTLSVQRRINIARAAAAQQVWSRPRPKKGRTPEVHPDTRRYADKMSKDDAAAAFITNEHLLWEGSRTPVTNNRWYDSLLSSIEFYARNVRLPSPIAGMRGPETARQAERRRVREKAMRARAKARIEGRIRTRQAIRTFLSGLTSPTPKSGGKPASRSHLEIEALIEQTVLTDTNSAFSPDHDITADTFNPIVSGKSSDVYNLADLQRAQQERKKLEAIFEHTVLTGPSPPFSPDHDITAESYEPIVSGNSYDVYNLVDLERARHERKMPKTKDAPKSPPPEEEEWDDRHVNLYDRVRRKKLQTLLGMDRTSNLQTPSPGRRSPPKPDSSHKSSPSPSPSRLFTPGRFVNVNVTDRLRRQRQKLWMQQRGSESVSPASPSSSPSLAFPNGDNQDHDSITVGSPPAATLTSPGDEVRSRKPSPKPNPAGARELTASPEATQASGQAAASSYRTVASLVPPTPYHPFVDISDRRARWRRTEMPEDDDSVPLLHAYPDLTSPSGSAPHNVTTDSVSAQSTPTLSEVGAAPGDDSPSLHVLPQSNPDNRDAAVSSASAESTRVSGQCSRGVTEPSNALIPVYVDVTGRKKPQRSVGFEEEKKEEDASVLTSPESTSCAWESGFDETPPTSHVAEDAGGGLHHVDLDPDPTWQSFFNDHQDGTMATLSLEPPTPPTARINNRQQHQSKTKSETDANTPRALSTHGQPHIELERRYSPGSASYDWAGGFDKTPRISNVAKESGGGLHQPDLDRDGDVLGNDAPTRQSSPDEVQDGTVASLEPPTPPTARINNRQRHQCKTKSESDASTPRARSTPGQPHIELERRYSPESTSYDWASGFDETPPTSHAAKDVEDLHQPDPLRDRVVLGNEASTWQSSPDDPQDGPVATMEPPTSPTAPINNRQQNQSKSKSPLAVVKDSLASRFRAERERWQPGWVAAGSAILELWELKDATTISCVAARPTDKMANPKQPLVRPPPDRTPIAARRGPADPILSTIMEDSSDSDDDCTPTVDDVMDTGGGLHQPDLDRDGDVFRFRAETERWRPGRFDADSAILELWELEEGPTSSGVAARPTDKMATPKKPSVRPPPDGTPIADRWGQTDPITSPIMEDPSDSDEDWTPTADDVMGEYVQIRAQTNAAASRAPTAAGNKFQGNRRAPMPRVQNANRDGNSENEGPKPGSRTRRMMSKVSGPASRILGGATNGATKQRVGATAPAAKVSNRNHRRIPREAGACAPTRQPSNKLAMLHKWKRWPAHWLQVGVKRVTGNTNHVDYYYYPPYQGQPDWDARSGIVCRSFPDVFKYLRSQRPGTSE